MGTTTRGYPYPGLDTDPPNGPAQMQALATAIDTDITATLDGVHSFGSTTTAQGFASGGTGTVNTWSLTTKNMTYSSGTWTITKAGFYFISAGIAFNGISSPSGIRSIDIVVNGTAIAEAVSRGDAGFAIPISVVWGQTFAVGDAIAITGYQSQGSALALSGYGKQNYVSIRRSGNS